MNIKNIIIAGILLLMSTSFPGLTSAVESCGGTCPGGIGEGDAALGVNFTGLQPLDLNAGSFNVSASSGGSFSCDWGGGIADNNSSCTAHFNSSNGNIECLIEHIDCRNNPFNINISAPLDYNCSASPSSISLANCSDNSFITVNCTTPVCVPDGSCSAPTPACGQTTSGTDNCGSACSKTGPACPVDGSSCTAISVNNGNAVTSGQSYSATVSMKNPSNTSTQTYNTWTTSAGYKLGSSNPRDNTVWGLNRVALPSTTTPGNTAFFNFNVTAPSVTSQTSKPFYWEMVREDVDWFGSQCQYNVTVNPPAVGTPMTITCVARDSSGNTITTADIGQPVTWRTTVDGGIPSFNYSWTGTDGLSSTISSSTSRTNTTTKTYSIAGSKSATITVNDSDSTTPQAERTCSVLITAPTPTVSLTANPSSIANNASSSLSWTTTSCTTANSCSCTASGDWSGAKSISGGSQSTGNLTGPANYTYTLTCTNGSGTSLPSTANVSVGGATCTAETNSAFCTRLGKNCGSVTGTDNCGTSRTVSCGICSGSQTCGGGGIPNVCGGGSCTAETDSAFCTRLGKNCGSVTGTDNCGTSRTVSCGTFCPSGQTCGGGGTPNVCDNGNSSTNCAWFQTTGGDVHSNTGINTPCGP